MRTLSFLFLLPFLAVAADWGQANWLWDHKPSDKASNAPRHFRRIIELPAAPKKAIIQLTADNHYTLFLNGKELGKDGNWNSAERISLPLVAGTNTVRCEVRNQGGSAGFIASIEIDGKAIPSDQHWQVSLDGESWSPATILGNASMGPWNLKGKPSAVGGDNPSDRSIKKYQSAELEAPMFILPEGFEIELVAAEPLLINPVTIAQDEAGRIYVSESHTYRFGPGRTPVKPYRNPVIRLDPNPDGSFTRTLVCDGFEDPVMGIAIDQAHLYVTANNYLYRFTRQPDGSVSDRETLLVDANKAWNPFGMFVLEWGPDDLLYLSVGNHKIDIANPAKPEARISGRANSGIVMRMHRDGHSFERLVHGLRVPYSFEMDPFANLWLLSNGQGNPNRFLRVIPGVDYHCYSRKVPGDWLAGRHRLAPPCEELPRGATTQLIRYYGSNFPADYRGSLFLDNWGAHGFPATNRTIFRYVTDDNDNIIGRERFLECADPHFRPAHILIQPDGTMLVADWYGRDDESDLTGRIWRVSYSGDAPRAQPDPAVAQAKALWKDRSLADSALKSEDWRLRRLALLLSDTPNAEFANDPHPSVAVAASNSLATLRRVAADPLLRYEAAVKHAPIADSASFANLVADADPEVRTAGLILLDIILWEDLPNADAAIAYIKANLDNSDIQELAKHHNRGDIAAALREKTQPPPDLAALRKSGVKVTAAAQIHRIIDVLGPDDADIATALIGQHIDHGDQTVRERIEDLARQTGTAASAATPELWDAFRKAKKDERLRVLSAIESVQTEPDAKAWTRLLVHKDKTLAEAALRAWRKMPSLKTNLVDAELPDSPDFRAVLATHGVGEHTPATAEAVIAAYRGLGRDAKKRVLPGKRVFTAAGCFACHTLGREAGPLAPSLHRLGSDQSVDYLVDSILNPSAVLKTGYLMETVTLKDGAIHTGLVSDDGEQLTIRLADSATQIAKSAIAKREPLPTSLMPPGMAAGLSVDEFRDLLAFLMSL